MNIETIRTIVKGKELDFTLAKRLSEDIASDIIKEPMLIAWLDVKKGEEFPQIPECQNKPGWLAYAESHGGRIRIDVNENEYSFIFTDAGVSSD